MMAGELTAIDDFVHEQMDAGLTPGLAITIVRDGTVLLQRGYGYADLETQTPMTEHTGSMIGSTTKALTCLALIQLVEAGLLDLDAPIQRYLPEFHIADPDASALMTVRQAITHTAGLPPSRSDDPSFLFNTYNADDATERGVAALTNRQPLWSPGGGWVYANDGYTIAGRIIEVLSGIGYEEYMRRHVFAPLGLTDSVFSPDERPGTHLATPYDYDHDGSPYPSFIARNRGASAAGAQLFMSARDAGRWLQALLDKGQVGETRLCSEQGIAELLTPFAKVPDVARGDEGADIRYGLGWMISTLNGIPAISHGGSTITMGSQFILAPQEQLAVAVVTNSSTDVTGIVGEGALSILLGREPARRFPQVDRSYVPDRTLWPRLVGTYQASTPQNTIPGPLPIVYEDGRLQASTYAADDRRRAGNIHLYPVGDLQFVLFGRGKTGNPAAFSIEGDTVRATMSRVPLVKIS